MPSPTTCWSGSAWSRCARPWSPTCSTSFPWGWKPMPPAESAGAMSTKLQTVYDVNRIRADFPILQLQVRGKPLVYLDNAATTQKPRSVIEALSRYYSEGNANIHRGVHFLSEHATAAYEAVRAQVAAFVGAADPAEIIFVRGTTEAINLVAQSYGRPTLARGDEIVVTTLEHHSNIVP